VSACSLLEVADLIGKATLSECAAPRQQSSVVLRTTCCSIIRVEIVTAGFLALPLPVGAYLTGRKSVRRRSRSRAPSGPKSGPLITILEPRAAYRESPPMSTSAGIHEQVESPDRAVKVVFNWILTDSAARPGWGLP